MKEAEARGLENVNRIDILFDRLVDFPRRSVQLLEGYLKNLDVDTKEHDDIESEFLIVFFNCHGHRKQTNLNIVFFFQFKKKQ